MAKAKRIWRESQHPRDARGRFARRGGAAWIKRAAAELTSAADAVSTRSASGRPQISRSAKAGVVLQAHADGGRPSAVRVPQATITPRPSPAGLAAFNAQRLPTPRKAAAPPVRNLEAFNAPDPPKRKSWKEDAARRAALQQERAGQPMDTPTLSTAELNAREDAVRDMMRGGGVTGPAVAPGPVPVIPARRTPRPAPGAAAFRAQRAEEQAPQMAAMIAARTAPESAPVPGAADYASMRQHTLVSLARQAGVPHRNRSRTEIANDLARHDAEVAAKRKAKLNPSGVGTPAAGEQYLARVRENGTDPSVAQQIRNESIMIPKRLQKLPKAARTNPPERTTGVRAGAVAADGTVTTPDGKVIGRLADPADRNASGWVMVNTDTEPAMRIAGDRAGGGFGVRVWLDSSVTRPVDTPRDSRNDGGMTSTTPRKQVPAAAKREALNPPLSAEQKAIYDKMLGTDGTPGLVQNPTARRVVEQMEAHGWELIAQDGMRRTVSFRAPDGREIHAQFLLGKNNRKPQFYIGQGARRQDVTFKAAMTHVITPHLAEVPSPYVGQAMQRVGLPMLHGQGWSDPPLASRDPSYRPLQQVSDDMARPYGGGTPKITLAEGVARLRQAAETNRKTADDRKRYNDMALGGNSVEDPQSQTLRQRADEFERVADELEKMDRERKAFEAERDRRAALPPDIRPGRSAKATPAKKATAKKAVPAPEAAPAPVEKPPTRRLQTFSERMAGDMSESDLRAARLRREEEAQQQRAREAEAARLRAEARANDTRPEREKLAEQLQQDRMADSVDMRRGARNPQRVARIKKIEARIEEIDTAERKAQIKGYRKGDKVKTTYNGETVEVEVVGKTGDGYLRVLLLNGKRGSLHPKFIEGETPAPKADAAPVAAPARARITPDAKRGALVRAQVRDAYADAARMPGDWVPLAEIRDRLDAQGLTRAEVDAALEKLAVTPGVQVIPWDNAKALTARDRAAALDFGGEMNHNIRIEGVTPTAPVDTPRVKSQNGGEGTSPTTEATMTPAQARASERGAGREDRMAASTRPATPGAKTGETTLGVTESSRGRTTTVTLPDGTTAQRTSKTMAYTHAVVATRDLHADARDLHAEAEAAQRHADAYEAWINAGANLDDLVAVPNGAGSVRDDRMGLINYNHYLPGFEARPNGRYRSGDTRYEGQPGTFIITSSQRHRSGGDFNYTDYEGYQNHRERLAKARQSREKTLARAAELEAGPQHEYYVARWSQRVDTAHAAIGSPEVNAPNTTYQVIGVGGVAKDNGKPVKKVPTAEEKAAALEAKKAAEKVAAEQRKQDFFDRAIRGVTEALANPRTEPGTNSDPNWHLGFTEAGLVSLAKHLGVKVPRREKTSYGTPKAHDPGVLRKLIIDAIQARSAEGKA
jgi:hypothetical protein